MKKVFAYIDGFNVYHSLLNFIKENKLSRNYLKWTDYRKLLQIFINSSQETIEKIYFFTAPPTHIQCKEKIERHEHYIRTLTEYLSITVISGRFGKKTIECTKCKESIRHHEEKETDVSLGIQVVHDILKEVVDKIILVSGDTDFMPVLSYVLENTEQEVTVLTPLGQLRSPYFRNLIKTIKSHNSTFDSKRFSHKHVLEQHMKQSQLPDTCLLPSGNSMHNPYVS